MADHRPLRAFLIGQLEAARARAALLARTAAPDEMPSRLRRLQNRCDDSRRAVSRTIGALEGALASAKRERDHYGLSPR